MQSVPEMSLRVMPPFYDHPDYIRALVGSAAEYLECEFDHLLFSFHGLPERHLRKIEPISCYCLSHNPESFQGCAQPTPIQDRCYRAQCFKTVEAFAELAGLSKMKFSVAFQSRLGRERWLKPYTDHVIARLGMRGVKKLMIICPAFVTDCLETLEEIGIRGRETFRQAGGEELTLIPCLNEHPLWIRALEKMINDWRISNGMRSAKQTTRCESLCKQPSL
jgi:ferrochelatase